jgi:hypothetical protein
MVENKGGSFMAKKCLVWYLACFMLALAIAPRAEGGFSSSQAIADRSGYRSSDLEGIRNILETKAVSGHLAALGFTTREIETRLSAMSNQEIHAVATHVKEMRAGGAAEGFLIGVAVIILVILVILPLLGVKVWR